MYTYTRIKIFKGISLNKILLSLPFVVFVFNGCVGNYQIESHKNVQKYVQNQIAYTQFDANISMLLNQPFSSENAVQIALIHNPTVKAKFLELGIAHSEVIQAGLFANPTFSFGIMKGQEKTTMSGIELNFLDIIMQGTRKSLEEKRFATLEFTLSHDIVSFAHTVKNAYYDALAAELIVQESAKLVESSSIAAEMGKRQYKAGNLSLKESALLEKNSASVTLAHIQRLKEAKETKEHLYNLLGLSPDIPLQWAKVFPTVQIIPQDNHFISYALAHRFDMKSEKKEFDYVAQALEVTKTMRYVNIIDLGYEIERKSGERLSKGPSIRLEIPLFDRGDARVKKYEQTLKVSEQRLLEKANIIVSDVRRTYDKVTYTFEMLRHIEKNFIPKTKEYYQQTGLWYNGMLVGVYELLESFNTYQESRIQFIQTQKEYWLALNELELALGGQIPSAQKE